MRQAAGFSPSGGRASVARWCVLLVSLTACGGASAPAAVSSPSLVGESSVPERPCPPLRVPGSSGECSFVAPIEAEEVAVRFKSGETPGGQVTLRGTLSVPRWSPDGPAPRRVPGVVLVQGSGPQSREGWIAGDLRGRYAQPIPVLTRLAAALSQHGYVVMRYDKRTCTPRADAGCRGLAEDARAATWPDLVGDVVAATEVIRARADVDPDDVILLGHSQGATLALEAQRRVNPSALVLLSGTYSPIDEVIGRQLAWMRTHKMSLIEGSERQRAELQVNQLEATLAAISAGRVADDVLFMNARASFWRDWIQASARTGGWLLSFDRPLLYVGGGDDQNVDDQERLAVLKALSGRHGMEVVLLPELSHALHRRHGAGELDPDAVDVLLEWLYRVPR